MGAFKDETKKTCAFEYIYKIMCARYKKRAQYVKCKSRYLCRKMGICIGVVLQNTKAIKAKDSPWYAVLMGSVASTVAANIRQFCFYLFLLSIGLGCPRLNISQLEMISFYLILKMTPTRPPPQGEVTQTPRWFLHLLFTCVNH